MVQYIDKSALVAEIEKWISGWTERLNNTNPSNPSFFEGGIEMGKHILSFIDTLAPMPLDLEQGPGYWKGKYFKLKEQMQALVDSRDDTIKEEPR